MQNFTLTISGQDISVLAEDEIRVTTSRKGAGKMAFNLYNKGDLRVSKGDIAVLAVDGYTMFRGRVTKSLQNKQKFIKATCHDQILTLVRNKETYVYENKTADEVVRMIAGDFGLTLGDVASTGFKVPLRVEDIQALLDIIYVAIDLTVINTGNLFVLYDDYGSIGSTGGLTLKNIRTLRINKLISSEEALEDFEYTEDIGGSTYNKIKLVRDNEYTGRRDVFIEKDSDNIARWGLFQLHEKVSDNLTEGQVISLAQRKLALHNRVTSQFYAAYNERAKDNG